jgi:hypothetical protein
MKFTKSLRNAKLGAAIVAKNPEMAKSAVPFSGESLTQLIRGFYKENKETALAAAVNELASNRGYKKFTTKEGKLELMAVMEGTKRLKSGTKDKKAILTTGKEKKVA